MLCMLNMPWKIAPDKKSGSHRSIVWINYSNKGVVIYTSNPAHRMQEISLNYEGASKELAHSIKAWIEEIKPSFKMVVNDSNPNSNGQKIEDGLKNKNCKIKIEVKRH